VIGSRDSFFGIDGAEAMQTTQESFGFKPASRPAPFTAGANWKAKLTSPAFSIESVQGISTPQEQEVTCVLVPTEPSGWRPTCAAKPLPDILRVGGQTLHSLRSRHHVPGTCMVEALEASRPSSRSFWDGIPKSAGLCLTHHRDQK
jgi:hypothetical protein